MRKGESDPSFFCYGGKAECQNRWKSETQEGATSWRGTSAVHQLVAFPRVSRLVLAAVWGSGGSPGAKARRSVRRQAGTIGDGASTYTEGVGFAGVFSPSVRPASRRVLPRLLSPIDGQIQESVRRCHHFIAAPGGPVGLEHTVPVPQVAYQHTKLGEQSGGCVLRRVPGNGPAHEVAIARALLVGTFAERGVGHVAGMQVGQLVDVGGGEGAALALGAGGLTGVPHVIVDDQKRSRLKDLQQRDRSMRADERNGRVHLDHRQMPSSRRDRIPFAGVRLFPNAQLVQFCLPGGPVDHCRQCRSVEASGEFVLIRCIHRYLLLSSPHDAFRMTYGEQRCNDHLQVYLFYQLRREKTSPILLKSSVRCRKPGPGVWHALWTEVVKKILKIDRLMALTVQPF